MKRRASVLLAGLLGALLMIPAAPARARTGGPRLAHPIRTAAAALTLTAALAGNSHGAIRSTAPKPPPDAPIAAAAHPHRGHGASIVTKAALGVTAAAAALIFFPGRGRR
jgi:hypothetical protein